MAGQEDVAGFLAHQRARGFSRKTIERRRSVMRRFALHIYPLSLRDATTELVESWVHQFRTPATRHAYRSDIVAFYEWAAKRKLVTENVAARTDTILTPKCLPRPIDTKTVAQVLRQSSDPTIRLWCALAAYAGLRCSEIAALQREDFTLHGKNPTIVVRAGKGRKDRIIPLNRKLIPMLAVYTKAGPIFDVDGETVGRWGSAHLRACGVNATMHQLRHTFGTELARASNGNIVLVAYLMGHSSMSTTMGYVGWAGGPGTKAIGAMYPS